jgi:hypothetical protein
VDQFAVGQPQECTLVHEFSFADGAESQLGDEEASRLAAHVLLPLLNVLRVVETFEDLHLSLLLKLVVEGDFEELLEAEQGNVVGENLRIERKSEEFHGKASSNSPPAHCAG